MQSQESSKTDTNRGGGTVAPGAEVRGMGASRSQATLAAP